MNSFLYNNVNSSTLGIRISSKTIYSAPKKELTYRSIPGRDGDIILPGGRLPNVTVSYGCYLPMRTVKALGDTLTVVKSWLYRESDRYHMLSDSYETDFIRRAVFNSKLDIVDTCRRIGVFTVSFNCHPLRFSRQGQVSVPCAVSGTVLHNPYFVPAKPYLHVYGRGEGCFTFQSTSHNETWTVHSLSDYLECDSEQMNFYRGTESKNADVSGQEFPILYPGDTVVSFTGGITQIDVTPRWCTL